MNQPLAVPTVFADTQALIYAFEKRVPAWIELLESFLSAGYRLVLSEEILYEFGQSASLDAALSLTRSVLEQRPLWIRPFADTEADEVGRFARAVLTSTTIIPVQALVEEFTEVSQLTESRRLNPIEFVGFAFDPRTRDGLGHLGKQHAEVLDALSVAVGKGELTKEVREQALRSGLRAYLSRGSPSTPPLAGPELEVASRLCFKHHRWLMRECPAYATESHLADYRSANPKRKARISDSKDLMLATAAFPYVTAFITNDGYLHGALAYVKARMPHISTKLVRSPEAHAA